MTSQFKQYYDKWKEIWGAQSQEVLEATALVRVMECTNGCVQWGWRDNEDGALSVEQTRECMKVSMGAIKSKVLPLPNGEEIVMPDEACPLMEEARRLYQKMKTDDQAAADEFHGLSIAHFHVLGKDLIDKQAALFREHFTDLFTEYWIDKGVDYIYYAANFS